MMKVKNHELIFHCIIGYRHNGFQRKNNELYSAKNLEMFQMYDTFPWEKIIYDVNDINTKVGSYWYDPIEFQKNIYKHFVLKEPYPYII
jgi:hypothetical protein